MLRHILLLNFDGATSVDSSWKSIYEVHLFYRSLVCTFFGLAENFAFWNLYICLAIFYRWLAILLSLCPLRSKTEQTSSFFWFKNMVPKVWLCKWNYPINLELIIKIIIITVIIITILIILIFIIRQGKHKTKLFIGLTYSFHPFNKYIE
jgi:hypothetical protein